MSETFANNDITRLPLAAELDPSSLVRSARGRLRIVFGEAEYQVIQRVHREFGSGK
jgi:hypothetical protein